jgi:serine phosphatase RsbU (regulator of sigma subunit)
MSPRRLSFKYKLALSVSAIILGLVAGVFLLIDTLMEKYVADEIERDLVGTCMSVARLMGERRARLEELAVALAGDSLIRTILIDKGIDRVTRDDILDSEILPSYSQLKLLAVLYMDGSIRAISTKAEALAPMLIGHPAVSRSLEGRPTLGFISHEGSFLQIAVIPVRIGVYVREVIGAVAVGMSWSMQDLQSIRELSHAEIAFFDTTGVLLSTGPPFAPLPGDKDSAISWSHLAALPSDWPSLLPAGPERFIVVKIGTHDEISPAYTVARSLDQQMKFLNRIRRWLLQLGAGGVFVGCLVSFILALGISRPIHILQAALRRVTQGDFKQPAVISSRDEFSELAAAFNRMQDGLIEREKMRRALLMAEEVQRNLLPAGPPQVRHLDVAGASIYCDAIGGDYYDYLDGPDGAGGALRVAVGDVCGHGTAAALLMATVRALLRSRSLQPGAIERVVSDVNRELTRDVKDSGRFMTLFVLEIDPGARQLRWVRAGHEPAIAYRPDQDRFEELTGPGLAIGVDADHVYQPQVKSVRDGEVFVLATDGVWEARSPSGAMYGKARVFDLIRRHAAMPAEGILQALFTDLKGFQQAGEFEDDATLVVVKVDLAG